jgi:hypothetical protein
VPDQPQPRRRTTDRDRRQWSDARLNDRHQVIDRRLDDLERFQRLMGQVPGLMESLRDGQERQDSDIRDLRNRIDSHFDRNFREHKSVQDTTNEIKETVTPSKLDWAVKFATIISFLLIPILAAYVAAGH